MASKNLNSSAVFVTPMAAVAVKQMPEGEGWLYEVKFDGYRALIIKHGTRVELQSRNHKDLTPMYPGLVAAALKLRADQLIPHRPRHRQQKWPFCERSPNAHAIDGERMRSTVNAPDGGHREEALGPAG